ncbi:hypothetical protein ACFRAR_16490 [Kitasatospora sp. NPDC056651]
MTVNGGGHTGDSCDGRYEAVPMSGDRNEDGEGAQVGAGGPP